MMPSAVCYALGLVSVNILSSGFRAIQLSSLYGKDCFTRKFTTCKISVKLYLGPVWCIFHIFTSEDIDDLVSRFFLLAYSNSQ